MKKPVTPLPPVTDWYPGTVKPARPGVYERELTIGNGRARAHLWAYWTGNNWMAGTLTRATAAKVRDVSQHPKLPWRGLRSPA